MPEASKFLLIGSRDHVSYCSSLLPRAKCLPLLRPCYELFSASMVQKIKRASAVIVTSRYAADVLTRYRASFRPDLKIFCVGKRLAANLGAQLCADNATELFKIVKDICQKDNKLCLEQIVYLRGQHVSIEIASHIPVQQVCVYKMELVRPLLPDDWHSYCAVFFSRRGAGAFFYLYPHTMSAIIKCYVPASAYELVKQRTNWQLNRLISMRSLKG